MNAPATWIDVALGSVFPLLLVAVIWNRVQLKRGIGVRAIQFIGVGMVVSGATLLGLHGLLQGEAIAAIFGTTVGYLLASIMRFDERSD